MPRNTSNQWPRIQPLLDQHMTRLVIETSADMPAHINIDRTIDANRHYKLYNEGLIPKFGKDDDLTIQHLRQIVRAHVLRSGRNTDGVALALAIDPRCHIDLDLVRNELIRLYAAELSADLHESEGARKIVVAAAESDRSGIVQQLIDSNDQGLMTRELARSVRSGASKMAREINTWWEDRPDIKDVTERELSDTTFKTFDAMSHGHVNEDATHEAMKTLVPDVTASESEAFTSMRKDKHAFMAVINGTPTEQVINIMRLCAWLADVSTGEMVHPCERAIKASSFALLGLANQNAFGAKLSLIFEAIDGSAS